MKSASLLSQAVSHCQCQVEPLKREQKQLDRKVKKRTQINDYMITRERTSKTEMKMSNFIAKQIEPEVHVEVRTINERLDDFQQKVEDSTDIAMVR